MAFDHIHGQPSEQNGPVLVDLDINGVNPFWSPSDSHDECLDEAHAILTFMASAFEDAEAMGGGIPNGGNVAELRHGIKAVSLRGVARLVAIARYCSDMDFHTHQRSPA